LDYIKEQTTTETDALAMKLNVNDKHLETEKIDGSYEHITWQHLAKLFASPRKTHLAR
jgi:type VI protein secretion system component Hcp